MAWIELKLTGLEQAKKLCSAKLIQDVLKYTVQDVAKSTSVKIKDKIKEGYNIRPSDLNKAFRVKAGGALEQVIQITDADKRGIGMFQLSGRQAVQTSLGTWVAPSKIKGAQFMPQAFIATMKNAHKGVFVRIKPELSTRKYKYIGKGGRVADWRAQIHQLYGPRITSLAGSDFMGMIINRHVQENAQRIFEQKLRWKTGGMLG